MKKMQGMGFFGMILLAFIIVFITLVSINIAPVYLHNRVIEQALEQMANDPKVLSMSKAKLKDTLAKHLQVNDIRDISAENLEIENQGDKTWLVMNYEARVHFIANIDAVLKFNNREMVKVK